MPTPGRMMRVTEAARHFGVDRSTIRRWLREGSLVGELYGRTTIIDLEASKKRGRQNLLRQSAPQVDLRPVAVRPGQSSAKAQDKQRRRRKLGVTRGPRSAGGPFGEPRCVVPDCTAHLGAEDLEKRLGALHRVSLHAGAWPGGDD